MTQETHEAILRFITLPMGKICYDGTTYRFDREDIERLTDFSKDLEAFSRMLLLSDGNNNVVGGVLFYDSYDIQILTLEEYRGQGYMSTIHKNGVFKENLFPKQRVTLATEEIWSEDDLRMKLRMLDMIGLKPKNMDEIERHMAWIRKYENESIPPLVD